jgi:hypothetical protein
MRDEDLERQLAKYAPAPPPPALRARIVSEARNAGRPQHGAVWRTLAGESFWLAAAALAICAVSFTVAADRAIARTAGIDLPSEGPR